MLSTQRSNHCRLLTILAGCYLPQKYSLSPTDFPPTAHLLDLPLYYSLADRTSMYYMYSILE